MKRKFNFEINKIVSMDKVALPSEVFSNLTAYSRGIKSTVIKLEETKRDKIRIRAGQRAMQYEERIRTATRINILKECLKGKEKEATKTRNTRERRDYLMKNGYSQAGIDQLRERNVNVVKTLKEKDKEVQKQTQYNKIREGQCNERYKHIKTEIPT